MTQWCYYKIYFIKLELIKQEFVGQNSKQIYPPPSDFLAILHKSGMREGTRARESGVRIFEEIEGIFLADRDGYYLYRGGKRQGFAS